MQKLLTICLLSLSLLSNAQKRKTTIPDRFAGLDTALNHILTDWKAPGFAVAIIEKNKVVYAKGFGYRDYESKLPVTPNTLFAIGSCTKAFTSSLIGVLQKDGKLELDKPVSNYLPELKFYNDDMNNKITLRDMMTHRTGLPRHDYSWYFSPTSRDSILTRIRFLEPSTGIRERWQYNNFMFVAQGIVAEKLTGKSWENNIKERFFKPLNMTNSHFSIKEFDKSSDAAKGYGLKKDSLIYRLDYFNIDEMGPAGSINSNVLEMANWVSTWINGGKFEGKEILSPQYVSEAISSQMVINGALPSKETPDLHLSTYGFGWMLSSYRGHYRVEHGGNIDGFSANTSFFPSDSLGIVVLTNQDGSVVPTLVRNIIADKMLDLKYYNWSGERLKTYKKAIKESKEAKNKPTSNRKTNTKPSHSLSDYTGIFVSDGYGKLNVNQKGDSLFLQSPNHKWWLSHYHYDTFLNFDTRYGIDTTNKSSIFFQFNTGVNGEIETLSAIGLEPTIGKPVVFSRVIPIKPISTEELKKYVGEFDLGGVTIKTYVKNDKTLYVFIPGQPEYELASIGNHKFNLVKLKGYSVLFDITPSLEVTAITFVQPNGNFKATKKK